MFQHMLRILKNVPHSLKKETKKGNLLGAGQNYQSCVKTKNEEIVFS